MQPAYLFPAMPATCIVPHCIRTCTLDEDGCTLDDMPCSVPAVAAKAEADAAEDAEEGATDADSAPPSLSPGYAGAGALATVMAAAAFAAGL